MKPRTRATAFGLAAVVLSIAGAVQAGTMTYGSPYVQSIHAPIGGSATVYDIVILAEGYRSSEMTKFATDAAAVRDEILAKEPWATYRAFVRIWQMNTISTDSGVDKTLPVGPDSFESIYRNTCFDCRYAPARGESFPGRLIVVGNMTNVNSAKSRVAGADLVLILVNDSLYGGAGAAGVATAYNGSSMRRVATHEMAHSASNLGDEYVTGGNYTGSEPSWPNLSIASNPSFVKWSAWSWTLSNGQTVGCSAGGDGWATGIYHPTPTACHMNSDLSQPYCCVCRETILKTLHGRTNYLLDPRSSIRRSSTGWENVGAFWCSIAETVPDATNVVGFTLDGYAVTPTSTVSGLTRTWRLDRTLGRGTHRVRVSVLDNTGWIRLSAQRPTRTYEWSFTQR